MTIDELEVDFKKNPNAAIKKVYTSYRDGFVQFCKSYSWDEETILDQFQESVIALYENLINNRINNKETQIKTYLYAIGKNKVLKTLSKNKVKTIELDSFISIDASETDVQDISYHREQYIEAFKQLGEKCKNIIILFYYKNQSIEQISEDLNYKNNNTVKAHKSRCMTKLRSIARAIRPIL